MWEYVWCIHAIFNTNCTNTCPGESHLYTGVIHTSQHATFSPLFPLEHGHKWRLAVSNLIFAEAMITPKITGAFGVWKLPICSHSSLITCKGTWPSFMGRVTCRSSPWQGCGSRWQHWTGCGRTAASAVAPHVSDRPDTLQRRGIALTQPWWCVHVRTVGRSTKSCKTIITSPSKFCCECMTTLWRATLYGTVSLQYPEVQVCPTYVLWQQLSIVHKGYT